MIRNDLRSSTTIPRELKTAILKAGGKNPFGEPLYRLILAQDRVTRASGEWTIWADNVPLEDRGGLGIDVIQKMLLQFQRVIEAAHQRGLPQHEIDKMEKSLSGELDEVLKSKLSAAPLRVETGMVDVQLYPFEGYILEKWKPAESFGPSDAWYSYKFNGEAALGPYPVFGDYELCAGPTPYLPTASQLEDAIRQDFRNIQNRPASAKERLTLLLRRMEDAQKAKERETKAKADAFRKDLAPLMNRLSLGAGKVRQDLANKAGLKGHYGN